MAETNQESNSQYSGDSSEAKEVKAKVSRSSRAGLLFPVSRIDGLLRKGQFAERIGAGAPVYMAAVLQYLTHEIMDITGEVTKRSKKRRISQQHLQLAIQSDGELKKVLGGVTISQGCVPLQKQPAPLPSKKKSGQRFPRGRTTHARVIVK
ncbi:histone H2A-beta, sperm [Alligator mississippiensis]|uniref:Histone H2A n=1 Tax=Alligator mississippiensis TaxID=8496 RepID=A0A151NGC5_ALLMI|nr:histone H2A-beta, sperm [Alligator mississippiensis]KYO35575.1 histone H2A-beta, sperm-like [Alligator mississippiensis]